MRTPKRNRRLQFEVMESRVVLSSGWAGVPLASTAWVGDTLPTHPLHQGVLAVSLTTDRSYYNLGQPVNMTLTETNNSSHDVTVDFGPTIDGFSITHNGATVWVSNHGPQPQYILWETLKPGQSFTLKATWNGMPNEPTGVFVVHNELFPNGPTATFTVVGDEVRLNGQFSGSFSAHTFPDVGTSYALSGQGQVQPLGLTNVTGDLNSLGFISQGHAGGTLTLSNSKGTLTLELTGPLQSGFSPLPDQFDYEITAGTGAYVNATGRGTAFLNLSGSPRFDLGEHQGRFDLRLGGTPLLCIGLDVCRLSQDGVPGDSR